MNEFEKQELKRKILIGCGTAVLVGAVILEKRRVDNLLLHGVKATEVIQDDAFEAGIKYGLRLAKDIFDAKGSIPSAITSN